MAARTRGGRSGSTTDFGEAAGTPVEESATKPKPRGGANLGMEYLKMSREQAAAGALDAPGAANARLRPIMGGPDSTVAMNPRKPEEPLPSDRRHPAWEGIVGQLPPAKPVAADQVIKRARGVKEVKPYDMPIGPRFAGYQANGKTKKIIRPTEDNLDRFNRFYSDGRTENARARKEEASSQNTKALARGFEGQPTALNAGLAAARTRSETPGVKRLMSRSDIVQAIQGHAASLQGYIDTYGNVGKTDYDMGLKVRAAQHSLFKVNSSLDAHVAAERKGASGVSSKHLWNAAAHLHSAHTQLDQPEISAVTKDRPAWEVPLAKAGGSTTYGLNTEHLLVAAREHYNVQSANEKDPNTGKATASPEGDKPLSSDTSAEADYSREVRGQTTNTFTKENNPSTQGEVDPTSIYAESGTPGGRPVGSKTEVPGLGVAGKLEQESKTPSAKQAPKQSAKTVLGVNVDDAKKAAETNAANFAEQQKKATGTNFNPTKTEDVIPKSVREEGRAKIRSDRQDLIDALAKKDDEAIAAGKEATEDYKTPEEREAAAASTKKATTPKKVNPFDDLVANIVNNRK